MLKIISRILDIFRGNPEKRRLARVEHVRKALLEMPASRYLGEPHVVGGSYHWTNVPEPVSLDIFLPDKPLAVVVAPEDYTPLVTDSTIIDRHSWKKSTTHSSYTVRTCRRAGIAVVFVAPGDPIDVDSMSLAVDEAFVIRKELANGC